MNRLIFAAGLVFCASGLFAAAPLEGGYTHFPVSASSEEKAKAFLDARRRVIHEAVKYVDTPYLHGGMSRNGVDCSGFVCLSFKEALGVSLPRTTTGLYSWVEVIPSDRAQPGDILFFKTDNTGKISHVGIYLGGGRFIHAASSGSVTGVKYSNLSETYYSRAFAGAGRAFPEALLPDGSAADYSVLAGIVPPEAGGAGSWGGSQPSITPDTDTDTAASGTGRLLVGVAAAPTWNGFLKGGDLVRGFASHLYMGVETYSLGPKMFFGMEVRPEYDSALGVFRLPITFAWGPSDKLKIFAGPVFSFGDASIMTDDGERNYLGGTNWIGAIGVSAAPFAYTTDSGDFAPYIEAAWQYYYSDSSDKNVNADFSAGFRFSTGIRWTMQVR